MSTDRRKILLGDKDTSPKKNEDMYLNVELSRTTDELLREIIDNNFNLLDQYNKERENSLRFCVYGTVDSKHVDMNRVVMEMTTNHNDLIYTPRKTKNSRGHRSHKINTKKLSRKGDLSKNIYKKEKASYYFLFELGIDNNNKGETKELILLIDDNDKKTYIKERVPIIFYDSENEKVPYGSEVVDISLEGETQVIENDFPFFYGVHWIRKDINAPKPAKASLGMSATNRTNRAVREESSGSFEFSALLDAPSLFGVEEVDIFVARDNTINNPNEDFRLITRKVKWDVGEIEKKVRVDILDDLFVEDTESVTFGIRNLKRVERGVPSTFTLSITDEDKPTPARFEILNQRIKESGMTLSIGVTLSEPMPVPGQYIDVIFSEQDSTAIIGQDFENMGTDEAPFFRKRAYFNQGSTRSSINIDIYDDLRYEFDKNLILALDNPSQNVEIIQAFSAHTITIEDSMVTQYTRYTMTGDSQAGYGIFRMAGPVPESTRKLQWSNEPYLDDSFTNKFRYNLQIINQGESIIYGDNLVSLNEQVLTQNFEDGFTGWSFDLPSNFDGDNQKKIFKKSKYKFIIRGIEPLQTSAFNPFGNNQGGGFGNQGGGSGGLGSNVLSDSSLVKNFDDVETRVDELTASGKGQFEYFMVSKVRNIRTRLKVRKLAGSVDCRDEIQDRFSNTNIEVNGTVLLNKAINASGFFGLTLNEGTRLDTIAFKPQVVLPYCSGGTGSVSNTLLLPFKYPAEKEF